MQLCLLSLLVDLKVQLGIFFFYKIFASRLISDMFYDRGTCVPFFHPTTARTIPPFVPRPTPLLSFYENKQKVAHCHHLLCSLFLSASFPLSLSLAVSLSPDPTLLPSVRSCKVDQLVSDLDLSWSKLGLGPSQTYSFFKEH